MNKKFMCWWGGDYGSCSLAIYPLKWFNINQGYESDDIEILAELDIGSTIILSDGDHIITRIE